eukprot:jgi/Ulvmu1/4458/UM002_0183.1
MIASSMSSSHRCPVVIDVGTSYTKAGFGGNLDPSAVFSSSVSASRSENTPLSHSPSTAAAKPKSSYPIKNGVVVNWSDFEELVSECFHERLVVDSREHPVLMTEPPLNPPENRETLAEVMFETFQVPALHIGIQAVLALYGQHALCQLQQQGTYGTPDMDVSSITFSTADLTGTVVDSGDGITHVVPIINGYVVGSAIKSIPLAGSTITSVVENMLRDRGAPLPMDNCLQLCRDIKERHCYVCKRMDRELAKWDDPADTSCVPATYVLTPTDGTAPVPLSIERERFLAPECYFQPQLAGLDVPPLQTLIDQAVLHCAIDARRKLYGSICLSGGSTLCRHFDRRLQLEVQQIVRSRLTEQSTGVIVKVDRHPKQGHAVWVGGSLLSAASIFVKNCHTREHYLEYGPSICRRSHVMLD